GSTLGVVTGDKIGYFGYVALTTNVAAAAGAIGGIASAWLILRKPDVSMMLNGVLAALVAITAASGLVAPWAAVVIGLVFGLITVGAFTFSASFGTLWTMKRLWGIRVEPETETAGLDVSEHGMWGYPEFYIPVPGGYGTEAHGHLGLAHGPARSAPVVVGDPASGASG